MKKVIGLLKIGVGLIVVFLILLILYLHKAGAPNTTGVLGVLGGWAVWGSVFIATCFILVFAFNRRAGIKTALGGVNLGAHKYLLGTILGLVLANVLLWLLWPEFYLKEFLSNQRLFWAVNGGIIGIAVIKNIGEDSGKKWGKVLMWLLAIGAIYNLTPKIETGKQGSGAPTRQEAFLPMNKEKKFRVYPKYWSEPVIIPDGYCFYSDTEGKIWIKATDNNGKEQTIEDEPGKWTTFALRPHTLEFMSREDKPVTVSVKIR